MSRDEADTQKLVDMGVTVAIVHAFDGAAVEQASAAIASRGRHRSTDCLTERSYGIRRGIPRRLEAAA